MHLKYNFTNILCNLIFIFCTSYSSLSEGAMTDYGPINSKLSGFIYRSFSLASNDSSYWTLTYTDNTFSIEARLAFTLTRVILGTFWPQHTAIVSKRLKWWHKWWAGSKSQAIQGLNQAISSIPILLVPKLFQIKRRKTARGQIALVLLRGLGHPGPTSPCHQRASSPFSRLALWAWSLGSWN